MHWAESSARDVLEVNSPSTYSVLPTAVLSRPGGRAAPLRIAHVEFAPRPAVGLNRVRSDKGLE